ncbi:MAG: signal peptide peptidase SppA [Proteobacteria bacterium]|nr:signal peptide peptidase SppA [Pseudomonadota bacterium]
MYMKHIVAICIILFLAGCFPTNIKLISDGTEPLHEFTVEGKGKDKILIVSVQGVINDQPEKGMLRTRQGLVSEVLAQLKKAESDEDIKAVVLKVDSPGGTVTASDILYNEIKRFKERKGIPVVVSIMNMGTSGAYYLSLPADRIMAHPTSILGSVGVIYMRPKVYGLMDKIGIGMEVNTSGSAKDMGSPFKASTDEEQRYFQAIIDPLAARFYHLVNINRKPNAEAFAKIKTAAVFLPDEALKLGLIDGIAYLPETISATEKLAGIEGKARVVTYRRDQFYDDTLYNNASAELFQGEPLRVNLPGFMDFQTGFYYLCPMLSEHHR